MQDVVAYIMPPYWQCPPCLFVARDFPPTPQERRECERCKTKGHTVFTWPGTGGEVYRAALHNLGRNDDWTSVALRTILLCSLAEVHDSRLMWSILVATGCDGKAASALLKTLRQPTYQDLFRTFVGEKRGKFERSCQSAKFWPMIQSLRKFRNGFVHGHPEEREKEMRQIATGLLEAIQVVSDEMETAFQDITNAAVASVRSRS